MSTTILTSFFNRRGLVSLSQRGRSGLQFLGALQGYSSSRIRDVAKKSFEADPEGKKLIDEKEKGVSNESWPARIAKSRAIAEKYPAYRFERFYQRFVAEEVYARSIPAIEEKRSEAEAFLQPPKKDAGGSLELDDRVVLEDWYDGVEWHLMPGGWDGYDLYGASMMAGVGQYVFKYGGYAAVEAGDDIGQHRAQVVSQFPKKNYKRIYEPGCGGIPTLSVLAHAFPDAELVGSDLSTSLLRNGHIAAEKLGIKISLKQRDARTTGEPDESFDAVIMYALQHEMPVAVNIDVFKEMFRILKPGGDIVVNDPPPFAAVDPFQAVILDWDTDHREEPYFSEACATEWSEIMNEIGFVDVEAYAVGKLGYPFINRGRKPK